MRGCAKTESRKDQGLTNVPYLKHLVSSAKPKIGGDIWMTALAIDQAYIELAIVLSILPGRKKTTFIKLA